MQLRYKAAIAVGFVGAIVAAAAAFGQTGTSSPKAQGQTGSHPWKAGRRVVHSESKIQLRDGSFALAIVDTGVVTTVDGQTVTIKRADDQVVSVTASDATRVRRDGEDAKVADIKPGDRAQFLQVQKDGTTTVRAIRAFSPDYQPKRQQPARARARRFLEQQQQGTADDPLLPAEPAA